MRVLHAVELYRPSVGGAQEVVRQVSERLAAAGHDVTVATTRLAERTQTEIAGVRIAEFDICGNAVRGIEGDVAGYRRFVADGGFDVVMAYAAQQWSMDALLDELGSLPSPVVLAPCGFSELRNPAWTGYFGDLPARLAQAAALIVHSANYQDATFLAEHGLERRLVPNGADEREFAALPGREEARRIIGMPDGVPLLLTVGGHTGMKGHAEVLRAMRRLRTPRARLLIVGNAPLGRGCAPTCRVRAATVGVASAGRRRAAVADLSRERTLAAFAAADVFVFASNVECSPIVLFEAVAAGLPFVSADVGNAVEIAAWTGAGEIAATTRDEQNWARIDEADLAARIDALLADPVRRAAMGAAGRAAWGRAYTWEHVAERYLDVYRSVAA